jgi:ethanolamine transporter EutH
MIELFCKAVVVVIIVALVYAVLSILTGIGNFPSTAFWTLFG